MSQTIAPPPTTEENAPSPVSASTASAHTGAGSGDADAEGDSERLIVGSVASTAALSREGRKLHQRFALAVNE